MRLMGKHSNELEARREQLMQRAEAEREHLMRRAEMGREELARRAERIREQFAENVDQEMVTTFAGWALVSTGIAWGVTEWARGRRGMNGLLVPIVFMALGAAVLGGGSIWHRRSVHIGEAEMRVREELAALDPFARFRVLRDVAEESVPFVKNISLRN